MKDRFRFRVWNKTEKVYLKMPEMHCDNTSCFLSAMEDEVLEQCTGLRDKNGRLIYEGDIIKITGDVMTIGLKYMDCLFKVIWEDNGFWFEMLDENDCLGFCEYWEYEIVGNLHENPELLEGKQCL